MEQSGDLFADCEFPTNSGSHVSQGPNSQAHESADKQGGNGNLLEKSADLFSEDGTDDKKPNDSQDDPLFLTPSFVVAYKINDSLHIIEESPVNKRKMDTRVTYGPAKLRKIGKKYESMFVKAGWNVTEENLEQKFYTQSLSALVEKFESGTTYGDKKAVLSIALVSLTQKQVLEHFKSAGATEHIIKKTVQLMKEQEGILPTPAPKKGRPLTDQTVELVKSFYELEDVSSRQMPGMKDYVSVVENGRRIHKQKRLILCTLKELHATFKMQFPTEKVSFSKFASLRPKHCVLAGAAGTHSVCVCKYHQNFKLLIEAVNFKQYDALDILVAYRDFISTVICDEPTPECYLDSCCPNCPGMEALELLLKSALSDNFVDTVTYNQWTSTDRCSLETITKSADEFVDTFISQLKILLPHHFIAKEQSKYLKKLKDELKPGEVLVVGDFAENYTCIIQDSAQSYYWKNDQVTIHPFVAYYKDKYKTVSVSLAVISDYMKHHVSSVYVFQRELVKFLKKTLPFKLEKMIYFSDGAASQYKNKKNVINISYHLADFGVEAEWHYFATSHGKGPCDGVGGALKRQAYLASLRGALIRSPKEFYDWAVKEVKGISVCFVTSEEVLEVKECLRPRFAAALSIPKMRSQHAVLSLSTAEVLIKRFSLTPEGKFVPVQLLRKVPSIQDLEPEEFVAVQHTKTTWVLGQILLVDPDSDSVLLNCFHKVAREVAWSTKVHLSEVSFDATELLALVRPRLQDGIYQLNTDDMTRTLWQLRSKKDEEKR